MNDKYPEEVNERFSAKFVGFVGCPHRGMCGGRCGLEKRKGIINQDEIESFIKEEVERAYKEGCDEGMRTAYEHAFCILSTGETIINPAEAAYEKGKKDAAKEILEAARQPSEKPN